MKQETINRIERLELVIKDHEDSIQWYKGMTCESDFEAHINALNIHEEKLAIRAIRREIKAMSVSA